MRRILPHPLSSAGVFAAWLLINETLHPAHLLLAAVLAVALPRWLGALVPPVALAWRPGVALRLVARLAADIVVANVQVACRILGPESAIRPRFVWMPLAITNPHGVAVLAAMITMTPGTISSDVSADGRWLLIHAFDVGDERELLASIRDRYEGPLRELFP